MQETVVDVMSPCKAFVRTDASVTEVALAMLNEHVRELPVVDRDGNLAGVVSADDLFSTPEQTIESVVKPARLVLPKNASSHEALRMMHKTGAQYAVVVDGQKLAGLIRWQDVLMDFSDC
jgi:CBS domain-containing protein